MQLDDHAPVGRLERPALRRQTPQIEVVRARREVGEDLPRAIELDRIDFHGGEARLAELVGELVGIDAQKRHIDRRDERRAFGEQAHLSLLGRIGRREVDLTAAAQDERRDAGVRLGHECAARRHLQRQVGRRDREVVDLELSRGIEGELDEIADRRELRHARDFESIRRPARRLRAHLPGGEAAFAAAADEHVRDHFIDAVRIRTPRALAHDGGRPEAAARHPLETGGGLVGRQIGGGQTPEILDASGRQCVLEVRQQPHDAVGLLRALLGIPRGQRRRQHEYQDGGRQAGHAHILEGQRA
jgi:hypothetical protein